MTYIEAVNYIIEHAEPHGLTHECLYEFLTDVEVRRERSLEPNYMAMARHALWKWNI